MKFRYKIQPYQTDAVRSVVDVFAGQTYEDNLTYNRDLGKESAQMHLDLNPDESDGYANAEVKLDPGQLLQQIGSVQKRNNITCDKYTTVRGMGACELDVEMETGTGKTYVYIKTIFELNKRYGWTKFIVVVPSIAIREGVKKSFQTMEDHFMEHYGTKARYFVYDSKNLARIDEFSKSASIQVMIINTQAFNARGKDARKIREEQDSFASRRPLDVIAANRPILILDEPQKMGGKATQASLKDFKPLFCLNYSATHKNHHALVYALDALDAYNMQLVKKIEVMGFEVNNLPGTSGYLYLSQIVVSKNKPPQAQLEFEVKHGGGTKREIHKLNVHDDLYALSNEMEQYRGYTINDIDAFNNTVSFTNGVKLQVTEAVGDVSEDTLRRLQIRETIRKHLAKEKALFGRGIKVLSLFFIDEVAKYRQYDEAGEQLQGEYAEVFEEEYNGLLSEYRDMFEEKYDAYLRHIDTEKTHMGYFSIDKKGHMVNSKAARGTDTADDISAYDLILKDKEELLSLRNPVRFIFSHSALREGWDNPNVFQICTLKHGGDSATLKRQEVGRGLRLCVNQEGERMDRERLDDMVHDINQLTVITSEGYTKFVDALQKDISADLYERPTKATPDYFRGKIVEVNGQNVEITDDQALDIFGYLYKNNYIDDNKQVTDAYREAKANNTLVELPEQVRELTDGVHKLIEGIFDPKVLQDMLEMARPTNVRNELNANFKKKEFQELWQRINHKYAYTVSFDSEELIQKAVASIDDNLYVTKLMYTVTVGAQKGEMKEEELSQRTSFIREKSQTGTVNKRVTTGVKYDLVGQIAKNARLTRRTTATILSRIHPNKFAMFQANPEEFITKVTKLINEQRATMIVEKITYNTLNDTYDNDIFTETMPNDYSKVYDAKKHIQDYVVTDGYALDGKSIERRFAEDMDAAVEVCVYAKLPKGFSIPTPVGNYSPDWAIAFNEGAVKHIYFVAETKGTMESMELRAVEQAKISCAKKLFESLSGADVVYDTVNSYAKLLDIVGK